MRQIYGRETRRKITDAPPLKKRSIIIKERNTKRAIETLYGN